MTDGICVLKGVCAWPNLQKFANGDLAVVFYNQPSHARIEGEMDVLFSQDSGKSWNRRATLFERVPGLCRNNHSAGAFGSRMVVLCGGWKLFREYLLTPMGAISEDGGRNWEILERPQGIFPVPHVPFGNIVTADNGDCCMTTYVNFNGLTMNLFLRSADGGRSWKTLSDIARSCNESCPLHLGGGRWIVMVRTEDRGLLQYDSTDDGASWRYAGALTRCLQVSGSLIRLSDGRILLSYGNRIPGEFGIEARISEDDGKNWSDPLRIAQMPSDDGGYPSTVELNGGGLLTLFYTSVTEVHRYEMRSVFWNI